jgi:formylglycine-generating enzyme required for sulfatase activity
MRNFFQIVIVLLACSPSVSVLAQGCTGDIVRDGRVDGADLGTLLAYWGPRNSGAFSIASDLNSDGNIDGTDLGQLLGAWGACPVVPWATVLQQLPDPGVVTNAALRSAIEATGLPWRVRDNRTGIEMLLIPPGSFQMGCSPDQPEGCGLNEVPVRTITLSQPFYIGRFEVTQQQWVAQMTVNPSLFSSAPDSPIRPVERVSWNMIQPFLAQTGLRLPTEAEWEFACRAGTSTRFHGFAAVPNGTSDIALLGEIAWYDANCGGQTRPVGTKAANGFGLHDMSGNVYEWVQDWYAHGYGSSTPAIDPTGPSSGTTRVLRSGSWTCNICCRSAFRNYGPPSQAAQDFGFRVARSP